MDIMETISAARDAITVKRVYGEPYERNGVVVIPAAAVQGGGGGGGGEADGQSGSGGGFALRARPVGAQVLTGSGCLVAPAAGDLEPGLPARRTATEWGLNRRCRKQRLRFPRRARRRRTSEPLRPLGTHREDSGG